MQLISGGGKRLNSCAARRRWLSCHEHFPTARNGA